AARGGTRLGQPRGVARGQVLQVEGADIAVVVGDDDPEVEVVEGLGAAADAGVDREIEVPGRAVGVGGIDAIGRVHDLRSVGRGVIGRAVGAEGGRQDVV